MEEGFAGFTVASQAHVQDTFTCTCYLSQNCPHQMKSSSKSSAGPLTRSLAASASNISISSVSSTGTYGSASTLESALAPRAHHHECHSYVHQTATATAMASHFVGTLHASPVVSVCPMASSLQSVCHYGVLSKFVHDGFELAASNSCSSRLTLRLGGMWTPGKMLCSIR
eukprot:CAMPEP_0119338624 /NCGR_PEP_ID=MMETSP1333-20130426/96526_1 /TAXON_ID=418940 /ORGANISM="Scyphosphaera apsteinii, Strain RCC1455" /LENGTH=169 /DNA_ID=CAMNT_0007349951 /DNA_START=91 /DNA_END=601 /DNA_ORIENTATION=-